MLDRLSRPVVLAPMAGGPATPELALATLDAGGLGFLAAGNAPASALARDLEVVRARSDRPFGVNVFADPGPPGDPAEIERYAAALAEEGPLGDPRHDDSDLAAKLDLLAAEPPAVVSFTFGCPDRATVARLRDAGAAVWITVTTPGEAVRAAATGADALVVQGVEAGGHRGASTTRRPATSGSSRCWRSSARGSTCRWPPRAASRPAPRSPPR